jgi:catechol 2,3-dioxygenase-like lactoylglutathione lyase family enzyme
VVIGADHVSFTVSNIERACEFYSVLLERSPLKVGQDDADVAARVIGYERVDVRFAYFELPGTETILELFEYVVPEGVTPKLRNCDVGNGHLGLIVDDLDADYRRLAAAGATFVQEEPVEIREGPWQGSKAIYMCDPDGITIELLESPPPASARFATA